MAPDRPAGLGLPGGYERRRPELTVLYKLLEQHWPSFRELADEAGGLPRFVREEVEAYLRCAILEHRSLEHGFLELVCRRCGHTELVAFSCKKRGF